MSKNNDAIEVSRSMRDLQPAHYLFKIESFSILEENIEKYDSDDFQAGGYNWGLCFYPNGNKKTNGDGHISLYLVIRNTDSLPLGWEVNVQFKFFVFDHIRDKYLTIQEPESRTRRFHKMKTEWGFDKLLSLDPFKNTSNGYLLGDSCLFGVEVFVIKNAGKGVCVRMINEPKDNTYTWKVHNFSSTTTKSICSGEFEVGGQKWKLSLYPKGNGKPKGESLSLFLEVANCASLPLNWKFYAKFKLRLSDQVRGEHHEREANNWFCATRDNWGFRSFKLLSDLKDTSKGFIVKDTLIVEAEMKVMSVIKHFS